MATNDLITRAKEAQARGGSVQVTELSVEIERYPELWQFWLDAATQSAQGKLDDTDPFCQRDRAFGSAGSFTRCVRVLP